MRPGITLPDPKTQRLSWAETWISYLLQDVPRRGAPGEYGLDSNTVGTYIRRLRTLLQFAGLPYAWLKYELSSEIDVEPLEYGEVVQLAEAQLGKSYLERARDCFVFNCWMMMILSWGVCRSMEVWYSGQLPPCAASFP